MSVLFTLQLPDKLINELYAYNFVTNYKPHQANHNIIPSDACPTSALLEPIMSRL